MTYTDLADVVTVLLIACAFLFVSAMLEVLQLRAEVSRLCGEFPWEPTHDGVCHLSPAENAIRQYRLKCEEVARLRKLLDAAQSEKLETC